MFYIEFAHTPVLGVGLPVSPPARAPLARRVRSKQATAIAIPCSPPSVHLAYTPFFLSLGWIARELRFWYSRMILRWYTCFSSRARTYDAEKEQYSPPSAPAGGAATVSGAAAGAAAGSAAGSAPAVAPGSAEAEGSAAAPAVFFLPGSGMGRGGPFGGGEYSCLSG